MLDISKRIKELNLPLGKYVVVGGAMEAMGIRKANDIDVVVTKDLFDELIRKGWKVHENRMLKSEGVDVFPDYSWRDKYVANTEELIENANVIDGVPYVQLEELLKWKKAAARSKDLKDVELIESFLREKK